MFSKFSVILFGLSQVLKFTARRHPAFATRLKEKNMTVQMRTADKTIGRWFTFKDGKITSRAGIHAKPDVTISFKNEQIAAELLMPPLDMQNQIDAIKDFKLQMDGPEELSSWFTQTVMQTQTIGWKYGVPQADGTIKPEPTMPVDAVGRTIVYMAGLPMEANVQFVTVMATKMPFIGRG